MQVITQHIPQQDLPGLYAAADVFVLPSRCVLLAQKQVPVVKAHRWTGLQTALVVLAGGQTLECSVHVRNCVTADVY